MIATLILAAGASTRLGGTPKQLLRQDGISLIRRITQTALSLEAGPVVVVLGANQGQIQPELASVPVRLVVNDQWQTGLASSLQAGLQALWDESVEAFLVLLTDQPFVTVELLRQLIDTQARTGRGIVACQYGETGHAGVPALFAIHYGYIFMRLTGDSGARKLIQQYMDDCVVVPFPLAAVDLDTWDDVNAWKKSGDDGA